MVVILRNPSSLPVRIQDIGLVIPPHAERDLSQVGRGLLFSKDARKLVSDGKLVLVTGELPSLAFQSANVALRTSTPQPPKAPSPPSPPPAPPRPRTCLMAGFYRDSDASRNSELETCRVLNARNPLIDRVVLFLEDCTENEARSRSPVLNSPKIQLVSIGRRMRFCDFFEKANKDFGGWIVTVANADVYLDETLAKAFDHDFSKEVLCLTRTETVSRIVETSGYSQDCWVFRSPLRYSKADWYLGKLGCDSVLSYELKQHGYEPRNPCRSIKVWHLHNSQVRHYTTEDKINGTYLNVEQTV